MISTPYTEEEEALIIRLYAEGKSIPNIHEYFEGRSFISVRNKITKLKDAGRIKARAVKPPALSLQTRRWLHFGEQERPAPIGDFMAGR